MCIRDRSWRRSYGSCGASTGASSAASTMMIVTVAAAIVTFERRNEYTMSLSCMARSQEDFRCTATASLVSAVTSRHLGVDADARIDHGVQHVDDQIDGHEDERDQQQVGRHDRDIDVLHGFQEQQAHAGPLEHALGDQCESDDRTELQSGDGCLLY